MLRVKRIVFTLVFFFLLFPAQAAYNFSEWPRADDAREFARLDTKLPAVMSYFSQHSQTDLAQLYRQAFGTPQQERSRYGQLELQFKQSPHHVRIIISTQQQWQQVDTIITLEPSSL